MSSILSVLGKMIMFRLYVCMFHVSVDVIHLFTNKNCPLSQLSFVTMSVTFSLTNKQFLSLNHSNHMENIVVGLYCELHSNHMENIVLGLYCELHSNHMENIVVIL